MGHLRNNAVYLDGLGACRIPDPTSAGDFCRRFDEQAQLKGGCHAMGNPTG